MIHRDSHPYQKGFIPSEVVLYFDGITPLHACPSVNSELLHAYEIEPFYFAGSAYLIMGNQADTVEEHVQMLITSRETETDSASKARMGHLPSAAAPVHRTVGNADPNAAA